MAFSLLHGVHVPHRKNTDQLAPVSMPAPSTVTIPMSMHIGAPAKPVVKVGDLVKVGTLIAEAGGFVSAPIHASVSGKVTKITDYLLSSGTPVPAVVIESDGEMTPAETVIPPVVNSRESLLEAIRNSGVVGLGGAGFPTHVKFNVDPDRIEYLVINGAECEPYVTSDTRTMLDRVADMKRALLAMNEYFGIKDIVIGIENNKKAAIKSMMSLMKEMAAEGKCRFTVKVLPAVYPQGGEKVLIYHTVGRTVPVGKLPIDVGCIVVNCTTLAAIGAYLETGMPLVEKCVTVDGGAVKEPKNVIVPIGTAMADVFDFCGGLTETPDKVVYGGPMMGITVPDTTAPILKNTNAILALTKKETKLPKTTPCIRCGRCVKNCPMHLMPVLMYKALYSGDLDELHSVNLMDCIECGCCAYICPASVPLVLGFRAGKQRIRDAAAAARAKS